MANASAHISADECELPALSAEAAAQRLRLIIGFFSGLILVAGYVLVAPKFLNDPDTLWHISVGRDFIAQGVFPRVDPYSHSFGGEPWIAKEWLSQWLLYASYALGGWKGPAALTILVLALCYAQLYAAMSQALRPTIVAGALIGAMTLSADVFLARPHILALPLIILFVRQSWRSAEAGRAPGFWLLGVLCLWANLHSSFTFGFVMAGLAFVHYLDATRRVRHGETYRWLGFLALCPLVSLLHPYGIEALWSTMAVAQSEAVPFIQEWRAFSMQKDLDVGLTLIALIILALASGARFRPALAIALGLLVYMYLTHARFIYLLALLTPMLTASALAQQCPAIGRAKWQAGLSRPGAERAMAQRSAPILITTGVAFAALLAASIAAPDIAPRSRTYPQEAIKAAREAGLKGNVMNAYGFGGALIFEGVPTFVDGRAERIYQGGFIPTMDRATKGDENALNTHLADYDIQWTIFHLGDRRADMIGAKPDWREIHRDEAAIIHARGEAQR